MALALFANRPVDYGLPAGFFSDAGFPFKFAHWSRGTLESFSVQALLLDLVIWLGLILIIPTGLSFKKSAGQSSAVEDAKR